MPLQKFGTAYQTARCQNTGENNINIRPTDNSLDLPVSNHGQSYCL